MAFRFKVFHSHDSKILERVHIVLVRPGQPRNIGSVARAMANMGIYSRLRIVSEIPVINEDARRLACHAESILDNCLTVTTLSKALELDLGESVLKVALTRRLGSSDRPHPFWIHEALPKALTKLVNKEYSDLVLVFGPENDGLSNDDVRECDWVVGIPADPNYQSLNLAQAVMVSCYELRRSTLLEIDETNLNDKGQKAKLIEHVIQVAEVAGFVRPGDAHKMKPYLSEILSGLPNHVKDIKTLHGLLDQVVRSIRRGEPDIKGRYKKNGMNGRHIERV